MVFPRRLRKAKVASNTKCTKNHLFFLNSNIFQPKSLPPPPPHPREISKNNDFHELFSTIGRRLLLRLAKKLLKRFSISISQLNHNSNDFLMEIHHYYHQSVRKHPTTAKR